MLIALTFGLACSLSEPVAIKPDTPEPASPKCFEAGVWTEWAPGLSARVFGTDSPLVGDGNIVTLRIDPTRFPLALHTGSKTTSKTARQWSSSHTGPVVVTNAGMFALDMSTHVGQLREDGAERGAHNSDYQSYAEFDPTKRPPFRIRDIDVDNIDRGYSNVMQNLRLIKSPGENRWSENGKLWSEAALGQDAAGNALIFFSRSPMSMHAFNQALLSNGSGVVAAQHLEGGPEAQMYVRAGGCEFEGFGSYETGFNENDDNDHAWAIPNALVAAPREKSGAATETNAGQHLY